MNKIYHTTEIEQKVCSQLSVLTKYQPTNYQIYMFGLNTAIATKRNVHVKGIIAFVQPYLFFFNENLKTSTVWYLLTYFTNYAGIITFVIATIKAQKKKKKK